MLSGGGGGLGGGRLSITEDILRPQLLSLREFRPFKTSDEYLWAMKEDLSDWLNCLYPDLRVNPNTFMETLETGVALCKHGNNVGAACKEWIQLGKKLPKCWGKEWKIPNGEITYNPNAKPETFFARDNLHNFITWCKKIGIFDCLLFESDDLILRKNEKNVILCLLEVARRGSHFGMAAPLLVQFEKEIDRDIAKETGQDFSSSSEEEEYGPIPQIITNDLKSLDEMVRELVERCSCPTQFPMIRISEGKYRIGNTKVMIYVRILRNHVMVRVGGGWDTLAHYLDKHDPCRCTTGHRSAISSKLTMKNESNPKMKVEYERRDLSSFDPISSSTPTSNYAKIKKPGTPGPTDLSDSSSEISDEGYKTSDNIHRHRHSLPLEDSLRKLSFTRTRSLSTDEERPDSRSTDEEAIQPPQSTPQRNRMNTTKLTPVQQRSQLGGNLQNQHSRSSSCERGRFSSNAVKNFDGRSSSKSIDHNRVARSKIMNTSSSGTGRCQPTDSRSIKMTCPKNGPLRSHSAIGTSEFFSRVGQQSQINNHNKLGKNVRARNGNRGSTESLGKNSTWNGSSTTNSCYTSNRPNLFKNEYFGSNELVNVDNIEKSIDSTTDCSSTNEESLNLAHWIRKALELESDAEKISHIELAISQFEKHGIKENTTNLNDTKGLTNTFNPIRKRKDAGNTKIPKPNFY